MSILIDRTTRVLVQGATGGHGTYQIQRMLDCGTKIVAGVTPGRAGRSVAGVPVFDTVAAGVAATGATLVVSYVPGEVLLEAAFECAEAGIETMVCPAEFVPLHDTILMKRVLGEHGARLVGPNTPGIFSAGQARAGFFATEFSQPGPIGVVSRSGTLAYGAIIELQRADLGQSTVVGIGGNQVRGIGFEECVALFEEDPDTAAIVVLGEVGGAAEERFAASIAHRPHKPIVACLVGRAAPPDTPMGHAGALISGGQGTIESKMRAFAQADIPVAATLEEIPVLLKKLLAA